LTDKIDPEILTKMAAALEKRSDLDMEALYSSLCHHGTAVVHHDSEGRGALINFRDFSI
jgi:hypothetical protein